MREKEDGKDNWVDGLDGIGERNKRRCVCVCVCEREREREKALPS